MRCVPTRLSYLICADPTCEHSNALPVPSRLAFFTVHQPRCQLHVLRAFVFQRARFGPLNRIRNVITDHTPVRFLVALVPVRLLAFFKRPTCVTIALCLTLACDVTVDCDKYFFASSAILYLLGQVTRTVRL